MRKIDEFRKSQYAENAPRLLKQAVSGHKMIENHSIIPKKEYFQTCNGLAIFTLENVYEKLATAATKCMKSLDKFPSRYILSVSENIMYHVVKKILKMNDYVRRFLSLLL